MKSSDMFLATRNQATLKIKSGVMTGDVTCNFNVSGSMDYNPSVQSSVAVDIKALSSPLEPAIVGGLDLIWYLYYRLWILAIAHSMA